ncbi:MAG: SUMF1/EgtB/PvdO family nonheme iron enzyme [Candidatus Methanoperedens sp.]|nr:SUMF1/EgtB/PvdO family nonheme iron enzyme [Candidatus Methanoperedens sp.]
MNNKDASQTPIKPIVLRESEFFGGCIRVKISVKNKSGLAILDAALELESDEKILHFDRCEPEYPEKKGKIQLGNINPNTDRTIAFYLDPLICAKEGTDVNCRVSFKDAFGRPDSVQMEPLKIKVVCPIFRTEQDVNIGRLKELVSGLQFHDSKVYTIPKKVEISGLLGTCRDVIQLHDVRHIKTFKTTDEKTYEAWYYGKTKVTKKDLVIKCSVQKDTESIEVFAAGNDPSDITGLLAEIGRNLTKEFEKLGKVQPVFNIHIKDSIIQRSNLLSFCNLDGTCGGDVVIEDSVVQRSSIGSWNEGAQKEREEVQKREREEQEHLRRQKEQDEERIAKEREELSVSEKKAGISQIKFLAVALVLGVVLIGYWTMTPYSKNAPETLKSTPTLTPKVTPTVSPTPILTQAADLKTFTNSIGMEFVLIPAGEFDMGSKEFEYTKPVHRVRIANAFYMGKYEVTQKQWRDVMGTNPSNFNGDNLPVESMSWNDAQEFVKKLNQKEGANRYRLPSEAEWEYAGRAGTTTRYSFGDDESKLGDYEWYDGNSGSKTHEVGQKKPNPWGLYDMYGNVKEWVQDNWHGDYNGAPTDGSAWEKDGGAVVARGCSWGSGAWECRSALRFISNPDARNNYYLGFRLLRIS